jgi:hypothetical protein
MSENFQKIYKKAFSTLNLLRILLPSLTRHAALTIYTGIILPGLLFNCTINHKMTNIQLSKLQSLDAGAEKITSSRVPKIRNEIEKRSNILVKKCLTGDVCENFIDYFSLQKHNKRTRNNGSLVFQPRVKLEFANSGFYCMGAKLFNSLPSINIRQSRNLADFKVLYKSYFAYIIWFFLYNIFNILY